MQVSLKDLEKIPWFAVVGAIVILSLLLNAGSADVTLMVPSYLTQAFLYLALGYAFMRGHTGQGFTVFLMAAVWLLTNILIWSNLGSLLSASLWLLCIMQLALVYMFFTGKSLKFAGEGGVQWTYAGLWLIFVFGLGKIWLALSQGATLAQIPLWGVGVLLLSLGYIVEPVEKSWATPFKLIGCLLAVVSGLTIAGSGLQLLP